MRATAHLVCFRVVPAVPSAAARQRANDLAMAPVLQWPQPVATIARRSVWHAAAALSRPTQARRVSPDAPHVARVRACVHACAFLDRLGWGLRLSHPPGRQRGRWLRCAAPCRCLRNVWHAAHRTYAGLPRRAVWRVRASCVRSVSVCACAVCAPERLRWVRLIACADCARLFAWTMRASGRAGLGRRLGRAGGRAVGCVGCAQGNSSSGANRIRQEVRIDRLWYSSRRRLPVGWPIHHAAIRTRMRIAQLVRGVLSAASVPCACAPAEARRGRWVGLGA